MKKRSYLLLLTLVCVASAIYWMNLSNAPQPASTNAEPPVVVQSPANPPVEISAPTQPKPSESPKAITTPMESAELFLSDLTKLAALSQLEERKCKKETRDIETEVTSAENQNDLLQAVQAVSKLSAVPLTPQSTSQAYALIKNGIPAGTNPDLLKSATSRFGRCPGMRQYDLITDLIDKTAGEQNQVLRQAVSRAAFNFISKDLDQPGGMLNQMMQLHAAKEMMSNDLLSSKYSKDLDDLLEKSESTKTLLSEHGQYCVTTGQCDASYLSEDLAETEKIRSQYRTLISKMKNDP